MYSGRGRTSFRCMCMLRKTGEAYGILGQSVLKESAICYFCMKNNMENAKKALTFGAKRNKLNKRVEKDIVLLMRKSG